MSTQAAAPHRFGASSIALAALVSVVVCALSGDSLAAPMLLAGLLLVPVGTVWGAVAQVRLVVVRRSAARRPTAPADEPTALAAAAGSRVQTSERRLDEVLLGMAVLGALTLVANSRLDSVRYDYPEDAQQAFIAAQDVLVHLEYGLLMTALVAIPFALVLTTQRIRSPHVAAGEAWALSRGGPAARRIRADRVLAWLVLAVYVAVAVAATVSAIDYTPSF